MRLRTLALFTLGALVLAGPLRLSADEPEDMLIIAPAPLLPLAEDWARYRRSRGRRPRVLDLTKLRGEQDDPAKVAGALKAAISAWAAGVAKSPLPALLLLGDVPAFGAKSLGQDRIPCFYVIDDSEQTKELRSESTIATDNPYACLDEDSIPELAIGRIPARSLSEGRTVLAKLERYESGSPRGPWRRRLTVFASKGGFGIVDKLLEILFTRLADRTIPYAYDLGMTYGNTSSAYAYAPDEFTDQIIRQVNEGALILNYIGHGRDRELDVIRWKGRRHRILAMKDLARIDVKGRHPIFLIVACYTGRYDRADDRDSIAETLIKQAQGPAAVIAASRVSHPYPNALIQKDFIELVCSERVAVLGEAFRAAKERLVRARDPSRRQLEMLSMLMIPPSEKRRLTRTHCGMYNLFGDPATRIQLPDSKAKLSIAVGAEGKALRVALGAGRSGEALVSLECERSKILRDLERVPEEREAAKAALKRNYARANDKVVRSWRVPVRDGKLRWPGAPDLGLPGKPGRYYLKLYAWGADWDAAGSVLLGERRPARARGAARRRGSF